ncbi:MAG: hypothetical protein ABMA15_09100 [Vicinamibacterales bacterium]
MSPRRSIFWVLAGIVATGTAVGALQTAATGTRREPQFDNDHVRVWKSTILPDQPLSLHRHDHGRTVVVLEGGTLDVVNATGQTQTRLNWETGKAYWLDADPPGQQHADVNRGTKPIAVMVVEMRR